MVNPTIEEAGHYRPGVGKCLVCREWWGMHSVEEENDHGMKMLDWLEKKEKTQKIFEKYPALSDMFAILPLREYFKNYHAPARDGTIQPIWITRIVSYGKYKGAFTAKEIREYFKNIPPIKDNKWSKRYLQSKKS